MPADMVVDAEGASGAILTYTLPTAADDTTAHPTVTCDPAPGRRVAVGAHTVTCTATDDSGNASTHAFTVTVVGKGSPPPVIDPPPPPSRGDVVGDTTAPTLSALALKRLRRPLRVRFTLGEPAVVRVVVKRKGVKRAVRSKPFRLRTGRHALTLRVDKLRKGKGRYTVTIRATDAAGNAAFAGPLRFKPGPTLARSGG
jgi:HYR domain